MIKCFLSHSSADKVGYVRAVAEKIKRENRIIDEETFEKGMVTADEILRFLDDTSLFVFFISNDSLNSEWVRIELDRAKELLDEKTIQRVFPIIIDSNVDHRDDRIPQWMRRNLNIQYISSPSIAARKINARLVELSWGSHPRLKERKEIFVGRNDQIKLLEERLDDFEKQTPTVFIASGLPSIGRRSLLQHALKKAGVIDASYEFPVISLSSLDSIEDFILKCCDLGLVNVPDLHNRINGLLSEKIDLAKEIAMRISQEKERVLIEDRGVIVQNRGEIVDWFWEIVSHIQHNDFAVFMIVSQFRPQRSLSRTNPSYYGIHVYELEEAERNGLLKRYSKFQDVDISRDEFSFFSSLLTGYPEQVLYAVDLIKDEGVYEAKKRSHQIQQFGSDKAKIIIDDFADKEEVLDFIYLLCRFEFVSYEVLFDIVDEEKYTPILEMLFLHSICERVGSMADYIRVNEVIKDYVNRNRFGYASPFDESIKEHVMQFVKSKSIEGFDISDYIFSGQEGLLYRRDIPDSLLVPSIFIKAIKKLYEEKRDYTNALVLINRLLKREQSLHQAAVDHVRFIKCQCLARTRNPEFHDEVRKLKDPEKTFLHGFNYRLGGRFKEAADCYEKLLGTGRRDPRVLGELTLVYMQSDEHNLAYQLAYESYKNRPGNILNANNYFTCLILRDKNDKTKLELESIIFNMELDSSPKAKEIVGSAKARLVAYYEGMEHESLRLIDNVIEQFYDVNYPILTKAEIAAHFMNKAKLKEALSLLESKKDKYSQTYRTVIRYKAMHLAMEGDINQAKQLVEKELRGLITASYKRLLERLDYFYENRS